MYSGRLAGRQWQDQRYLLAVAREAPPQTAASIWVDAWSGIKGSEKGVHGLTGRSW